MTAKEKAEKLVERMQAQRYMSLGAATQCALICVDEIIYELDDLPKIPYNERRLKHWQEVKQQINNL